MKGRKTNRHENNPEEKLFHDAFIERFQTRQISQIIMDTDGRGEPLEYITPTDETNAITLIQWLGSPVGRGFLRDCGYEKVKP